MYETVVYSTHKRRGAEDGTGEHHLSRRYDWNPDKCSTPYVPYLRACVSNRQRKTSWLSWPPLSIYVLDPLALDKVYSSDYPGSELLITLGRVTDVLENLCPRVPFLWGEEVPSDSEQFVASDVQPVTNDVEYFVVIVPFEIV